MKSFAILSLGCARNLVDSEVIAGSLKRIGLKMVDAGEGADVCVINTCAFIESARRESVDAIVEAARAKSKGKIGKLVICGCLPQLYKKQIAKEISEADLILGAGDFPKLAEYIEDLRKSDKTQVLISERVDYLYDESSPRFKLTPKHYAYVKISEGCSNLCSYCVISRLRGPFRSRTIRSVAEEVKELSKDGVLKEIDLIGQDTTLFGIDVYGRPALPELLRRLCGIKNSVKWIRLMYTHPAHYTDGLIAAIKDEPKICRYLDLPIQHISDKILKYMNRRTTKKDIVALVEKLRKNIPGLALRTSIIVGFPGETEKDFKELLNYIQKNRFERLGAFIYSKEEGTRASRFKGQVPAKVKKERLDELMRVQRKIAHSFNKSLIGRTLDVLIDEKCVQRNTKYEIRTTNDVFIGRTEADAPEIDCGVYVSGKNMEPRGTFHYGAATPRTVPRSGTGARVKIGTFSKVRITDAMEYDLIGDAV